MSIKKVVPGHQIIARQPICLHGLLSIPSSTISLFLPQFSPPTSTHCSPAPAQLLPLAALLNKNANQLINRTSNYNSARIVLFDN